MVEKQQLGAHMNVFQVVAKNRIWPFGNLASMQKGSKGVLLHLRPRVLCCMGHAYDGDGAARMIWNRPEGPWQCRTSTTPTLGWNQRLYLYHTTAGAPYSYSDLVQWAGHERVRDALR